MGDFNDRCVKWTDNHSKSELNEQLKNVITDLALYQMVDEATRISDTSSYILDQLITDSPGYINECKVLDPLANLDHCVVLCSLNIEHN